MSAPILTTQIGTVSANAGLQQNVTVNSPSSLTFAGGASTSPGTTGPGYATTDGSATGPVVSEEWSTWLIVLSLGYFGYQFLK